MSNKIVPLYTARKTYFGNLLNITVKKQNFGQKATKILHKTTSFTNTLNELVFPLAFQWNKQNKTFLVRPKLLKLYWLVILYKLGLSLVLAFLVYFHLFDVGYQCSNFSLPIFIIHIAVLLGTCLADVIFICNAYEMTYTYNWSYQIQKTLLAHIKIGN